MKIGIPKALIYWKRPYFWENFFKSLDLQVLLSPDTNKELTELGVKVSDPETCFANKVFWGHLLWLEGKCDYIFVPRLKTNEEELEYCPKFFAMPDLAKVLVKTPILTETFDWRKEKTEKSLNKLGRRLKKNKKTIEKALKITLLKEGELKKKEGQVFFKKIYSDKPKIVLISHPYNLYDGYINLNIKEKLIKLETEPIFIEEVRVEKRRKKGQEPEVQSNFYPDFHWEFGKEIMERIEEILKHDIAGAIELSSFQCGCDAVLKEFVEREFRRRKIPFLYLLIDEHTGEAGIQTRLEAFTDTL